MKKSITLCLIIISITASFVACSQKQVHGETENITGDTIESDTQIKTEKNTETESETETETETEDETETFDGKLKYQFDTKDILSDWGKYDKLIEDASVTTDILEREAMLHEAEDSIMKTGAIIPVYYYTDSYLLKKQYRNVYTNAYGYTYLMYCRTLRRVICINLANEPKVLDPIVSNDADNEMLILNCFSGLSCYTASGEVELDMAKDYEVSEDGLQYRFDILEDLKWSDGSILDADDFIFSWNRAANKSKGSEYYSMFDIINRNSDGTLDIESEEDGNVLVVNLKEPCSNFVRMCAFPAFFVVKNTDVIWNGGWDGHYQQWATHKGFICSGAYTLEEWDKDGNMTFTKNPNFHRASEVYIDNITVEFNADKEAAYNKYIDGDIHLTTVYPQEAEKERKETKEYITHNIMGEYYIAVNTIRSLYDGKTASQAAAMRRAFLLLLDRDYITYSFSESGDEPASTIVPNSMGDGNLGVFQLDDKYYRHSSKSENGYFDPYNDGSNVYEAIELLTGVGYEFDDDNKLKETISIEYITNDNVENIRMADSVKQDLESIGIQVNIISCTEDEYQSRLNSGEYDLVGYKYMSKIDDPIEILKLWKTDGALNYSNLGYTQ